MIIGLKMAKGKTTSEEKVSEFKRTGERNGRTEQVREKANEKSEKSEKQEEKPVWLKFNDKDVEAIILKLAKQGLTAEKIGLELRDSYGIPKTKLLGKRIGQILKENNLYKDPSRLNLEKKQQMLKKHIEKNKTDQKSKRAFSIVSARILKVQKYEKKKL